MILFLIFFFFLDPLSLILAQIRQPREPDLKYPGGITETHTCQHTDPQVRGVAHRESSY